ncbi:MAG: DEAD/DEAH box helicase [Acidimicrobiaceae bacterium]|nr:DEAD/DEAH box helicase [Acidimicrobiaceae bacterium]
MRTEALTIGETIDEIRRALQDYIEATYHISHPALVEQRKKLLDEPGAIFQAPFLESTPRYKTGKRYSDLSIPDAAKELLQVMATPSSDREPLIYDPPYSHQAAAIEATVSDRKNLVLTTGTGSGKTESFLLPILSKLAIEAATKPESFAKPAVRAVLLYPMNALVNDQLGRLRLIFGDKGVAGRFSSWSGRPARFARYTSRTPYPGVRTAQKDQQRLRSFGDFYVGLTDRAADPDDPDRAAAAELVESLQSRGKWPAKPDMKYWFGQSGQRWQDREGNFQRAVMRAADTELVTRHEVLEHPPDVLVTNYSMLEYMLMRPLERPIFDRTRSWLAENEDERLLLVVDEAHLYRGAAGSEVGLLLRRLRDRLGIPADRLQIICTSASFNNQASAAEFAAELTGTDLRNFLTITGDLALRGGASSASEEDAAVLAGTSLANYYEAHSDSERLEAVRDLLSYRGVDASSDSSAAVFDALHEFPPMSHLVNTTMQKAMPLDELAAEVFPGVGRALADRALTSLVALGSTARQRPGAPGLLPCRVHGFFRGLPGIWACVDDGCIARGDLPPGPVGRVWSQPRDRCSCGSRVFELFTCRNCGAAYARAYTDNVESPTYLWSEPGGSFETAGGHVSELHALDLLLEAPTSAHIEPADLDLVTGRLNPDRLGNRIRQVFMRAERMLPPSTDDESASLADASLGEFRPCGVCGQTAAFGRTSVQDHQTKGDQPFQALIARQLQVQPPGSQPATRFAPLQGRKILIFSDSRQTAARLAPNLQDYSMRDALRPLVLAGWTELAKVPRLADRLSLDDLYLAVLLASEQMGVRLRPKLKGTESLHVSSAVARALSDGVLADPMDALDLVMDVRAENPPEALLRAINETLRSKYFGMPSLALATVRERGKFTADIEGLRDLPGVTSPAEKVSLARMWVSYWSGYGYWFRSMSPSFWNTSQGVRPHSGNFTALDRWFGDREAVKQFKKWWLPELLEMFTENVAQKSYRMLAQHLALDVGGEWGYCQACRSTQRPHPGPAKCMVCGRPDTVTPIDPDEDLVFAARKGYYRASSVRALGPEHEAPLALIAAEHTAQLNAAQVDEVFSRAEQYELLFQDVDIGLPAPGEQARTAIDVLSSTTTMEVGIDIGALSGVALRNMPPARSSYQQRAGRAGRRGNAVATVVAFGSADSHDEQYFREPESMIRGQVEDPTLTLDNAAIARRHVTAYLFQRYHEARLPHVDPENQTQLFEVLGTVRGFLDDESTLSRKDFEEWLRNNEKELQEAVSGWLPDAIAQGDRDDLLTQLVAETLRVVDAAMPTTQGTGTDDESDADSELGSASAGEASDEPAEPFIEAPAEVGEESSTAVRSATNLLDRLLYKGVLPRYAFPTDVVSFHVFDRNRSTRFRPAFEYAPSQGLSAALTQYAPGKEVWIDGKLWSSGALYSPMRSDRFEAWQDRRLYFECSVCRYAATTGLRDADRGEKRDCPACGSEGSFGAAKNWMRPPGFAHPQAQEEGTSPEDQPARSYATRAKLVAEGPADPNRWQAVTPRLRRYFHRTHLLVTNSGPRREGYTYCTRCGVIGPTAQPSSRLAGAHPKPYPDDREPTCSGSAATSGLVLGTDFISDVLLVGLQASSPVTLQPGYLATDVALRTLAESITIAASRVLEIEKDELQAEYRPALTPDGHAGLEAEIYVYDTLAGGAGFAQRIGEMGRAIFDEALFVLEGCPSGCDHSCYRCLRSFRNRFEHELLDRHVGASLLRYLLDDVPPALDKDRLKGSTDRLFADLERLETEAVEFTRNAAIEVPGIGTVEAPILAQGERSELIVGVHTPLTPDTAADERLRETAEFSTTVPVHLVDEILITRNLPRASHSVLQALGL